MSGQREPALTEEAPVSAFFEFVREALGDHGVSTSPEPTIVRCG